MQKALSRLNEKDPLVIFGGDLVNRTDSDDEWAAFCDVIDRVGMRFNATFVSANGNFSPSGGYENRQEFRQRFLLPGNGPLGCENRFYSFDRGNDHFIVLDSHLLGDPDKETYKYIGAWIKNDLAKNAKPAVFAVMHHPVYTVGSSFDDDIRAALIRKNYLKLLRRYGIDMILCGHQHVYCRTGNDAQITQVMGVSGSKFFDIGRAESFACIRENVGVATIIESDLCKIKLETFDVDGKVLDLHEQDIRTKSPRNCGDCVNFDRCRGTGIVELEEAREKAMANGLPWDRSSCTGINVCGRHYGDEELELLDKTEQTFSMRRRNRTVLKQIRGIRLADLIGNEVPAVMAISRDGDRRAFRMSDILQAYRFCQGEEPAAVSAVVYRDDEQEKSAGYRIAFGQKYPGQYTSRQWIRNVVEIRTFDPNELLRS